MKNKPVQITNMDEFKKHFGLPDGNLLKLKYLKFIKIKQKIEYYTQLKHKYVTEENYVKASEYRDLARREEAKISEKKEIPQEENEFTIKLWIKEGFKNDND